MHTNDALSPNTMSTSMAGDDHSEASSLSSFEGPLPERPSEARRRIAPIVPGFFDRAVFADRVQHDRIPELRRHVTHNVNAFGL